MQLPVCCRLGDEATHFVGYDANKDSYNEELRIGVCQCWKPFFAENLSNSHISVEDGARFDQARI